MAAPLLGVVVFAAVLGLMLPIPPVGITGPDKDDELEEDDLTRLRLDERHVECAG